MCVQCVPCSLLSALCSLLCRSPAEAALERSIADVFEEVRARKVQAAKRGSLMRFPVNFMGKEDAEGHPGQSQSAASSRASSARKIEAERRASGRGNGGRSSSPPGRTDRPNDLGSVVSESDLHSLLGEGEGSRDSAPRADEVDLLRQPLVKFTGGISGLGVHQLTDNDRFSCLVKFLLQRDRFREVVEFLREQQQQ
jgi:hypothetical protein